ncbi:MAG: helix-turn-helix transcriptional regulator [Chloroflexota bacterium]
MNSTVSTITSQAISRQTVPHSTISNPTTSNPTTPPPIISHQPATYQATEHQVGQHRTPPPKKSTHQTEEVYLRFGESVRAIRRAQNLTQKQLAERADIHKTYVVRIESGDNNVTLKTAQKVAYALQVELSMLLKGVTVSLT